MRVLLTGGTGFLGRRVLRELIDAGLSVRCAVRPGSRTATMRDFIGHDRWLSTELMSADLSRDEDCRRLLDGCDIVYHAAAALSGCPSHLVMNTVVPTRTLLTAAADTAVSRVVLVSSFGVYGPQHLSNGSTLDESCPIDRQPHARDAYSYSKILQEQIARELAESRGVSLAVVRPGVIFGDERGVLSDRVGLRFGKWILRMGGWQRLPFTYVDNCAAAIVLAGTTSSLTRSESIVTINVVDNELPTGREVIRRCRQAGQRLRVIPIPRWAIPPLAMFNEWYSERTEFQIPKVLTRHRVAAIWKPLSYSNDRARQLLGWSPQVSFDAAIERTFATETGSRP